MKAFVSIMWICVGINLTILTLAPNIMSIIALTLCSLGLALEWRMNRGKSV